jgi:hypothetical protein
VEPNETPRDGREPQHDDALDATLGDAGSDRPGDEERVQEGDGGGTFAGVAVDREETGRTDAPRPAVDAAGLGLGIPAGAAIGAAVGTDAATNRHDQREDKATADQSSDPRPR